MKKFFAEFKEFISRGNVMDMAIGVILATAFGKITTSLVNDVFLPFLGWLIGDIDLAALNIQLSPAVVQNGEVVKEAVVLGLGTFISAVLDFILIAFIVFSIVKALNAAKRKLEKPAEPAAPAAPEPSNEEKLLTEIRDLLKNQK
jgi:large conductance mechanosensitive channel